MLRNDLSGSSTRLDHLGHDPAVFPDRAVPSEAQLLIRGQCTVEEKAGRHGGRVLWIAFDLTPSDAGDKVESASESSAGHTLATVALSYEATRDSPIRQRDQVLLVSGPALDPRHLSWFAELTPAEAIVSLETRAAWAVPARTRSCLRSRLRPGESLATPSGWKPMHQQPPKTPLFASTRAAKAGQVDESRALIP